MSIIFAMVTLKSTNIYTVCALESFFKYKNLDPEDEFLLINNDNCETDKFLSYNKIKIIKNSIVLNFAENVNQAIDIALNKKKDLIFLNNDLIFTDNWLDPIKKNLNEVSIPSNNQVFQHQSDCGNLKLKATMDLSEFNKKYQLLNDIVKKHKKKFGTIKKFQTLLMPFSCFKIPYNILCEVGHFDVSFGIGGGEDVDYRIRCALKGYEVNFLMDSFLLHFHGKSTWALETKNEMEKRNEIYTKKFLEKWGKDMTQIFILRKDFVNIIKKRGLDNLFKQGKFGDIIRRIN